MCVYIFALKEKVKIFFSLFVWCKHPRMLFEIRYKPQNSQGIKKKTFSRIAHSWLLRSASEEERYRLMAIKKDGSFLLWTVAEFPPVVLVKSKKRPLICPNKSFLQLSFKQCLYSPTRIRGFGKFQQWGTGDRLSIMCSLCRKEGENGKGRG